MKNKVLFFQIFILFFYALSSLAEEQPEIPKEVIEKMQLLQKGELNQLEKLKLADDLQRAGAKPEALALYEENLPMDYVRSDLPPEAYLNYGTALLEKGDDQKNSRNARTKHHELFQSTGAKKRTREKR